MRDANEKVGGCNVGYKDDMGRISGGAMTEKRDIFANKYVFFKQFDHWWLNFFT